MTSDKMIWSVMAELAGSINNDHQDNFDYNRFGKEPKAHTKWSLRRLITSALNKRGYYSNFNNEIFKRQIEDTDFPISDFSFLYDRLEDQYSKELLVKIIAYRIAGYKKIKLPLSNKTFWDNQRLIEANQSKTEFVNVESLGIKLPLTDLQFLNLPLKMYYSALGINIDFIIKQYEFNRDNVKIAAKPGDVVIDAGGCFGDTALYFANKVGAAGKVFVFEFIPANIQILKKNIALNPPEERVIELVDRPLADISEAEVYYQDKGPSSRVSLESFEGYTGTTKTITIDDLTKSKNCERVDFIKMDIEGAEMSALKGAIETIKNFKPELAIALYHSTGDFDAIPKFIDGLNLGYKFYLSHSTIYGEETMLFATTTQ